MSARILVVEDQDDVRELVRFTLEFKGYVVAEAANGRAGLEKAREEKFDLILCDIDMPVMHGLDFVRAYREEFGGDVPVIMLSAELAGLMDEAILAGATGAIHKPFEPSQLYETLEKYLP